MARMVGKASTWSWNGTVVPITSWKIKGNRECPDISDSSNYDATTDLLWKAQIAASMQLEGTIEGYFDDATTDSVILSLLFSGAAAQAVIFKLKSALTFGHGNFDMTDFDVDAEVVDEPVKFTCTIKSNGVFTHGA